MFGMMGMMNNMNNMMNGMMNEMMGGMMGGHSMAALTNGKGQFHGSNNMTQMMQPRGVGGGFGGGFGGGSFSCQQISFSSTVGADGRVHTKQYSSSTVADGQRGIRETKRAFSDSREGVEKLALEQQIGEQGRRMVKERNHITQEQSQTSTLRNIDEDQAERFDARWHEEAAPHLPKHQVQSRPMLMRGTGSSSSSRGADNRQSQHAISNSPYADELENETSGRLACKGKGSTRATGYGPSMSRGAQDTRRPRWQGYPQRSSPY